MDSSCAKFLEFKKLSDIRNRIIYYLGPLYYEDKVYVDNLVNINNIKLKNDWEQNFINFLSYILKKYDFEDKYFLYRFGDIDRIENQYCLVKNRWSKNNNSILLWNLQPIQRDWSIYFNSKDNILFNNKINKIFWRGSTTGKPEHPANRFTLVTKWFNTDSDIDVAFSSICQNRDNYKQYLKPHASFDIFIKYKYLLSVHGNDKDSGLNWKLASNSLVLMAKPRAFSWLMEDILIPDYHYILLKDDFSNLREKLDWCNSHPEEVKQIIKNANKYMEMFRNIKEQEYIEKEVLRLYFEKIISR